MNKSVEEVVTALTSTTSDTQASERFTLIIRDALLMDANPPSSPSEGGLPDLIQASIKIAEDIIHAVNEHGMSKSSQLSLRSVAYAPLVLLAGALLRSQRVEVSSEQIAYPRRVCQALNAYLWGS